MPSARNAAPLPPIRHPQPNDDAVELLRTSEPPKAESARYRADCSPNDLPGGHHGSTQTDRLKKCARGTQPAADAESETQVTRSEFRRIALLSLGVIQLTFALAAGLLLDVQIICVSENLRASCERAYDDGLFVKQVTGSVEVHQRTADLARIRSALQVEGLQRLRVVNAVVMCVFCISGIAMIAFELLLSRTAALSASPKMDEGAVTQKHAARP